MKALRVLFVALVCAVLVVGCKKKVAPTDNSVPFAVNDASQGFFFIWIDAKGDCHTEEQAKDVPLVGRDIVRVIDSSREEGTHDDRIFIADLRSAGPAGNYPTRVATRAEFDAIVLARRQGKLATLADDAGVTTVPNASEVASGDVAPNRPELDPNAIAANGPTPVIIYGASWCGPCHQAAAYLRQKNVPFMEKDIEKDSGAAREMQGKLARAGMHTGSIPVIDVHGKLMVGFNAQEIDRALGTSL